MLATGVGLWLVAFRRTVPLGLVGAALIFAPHLIGAPQPASHDSPVPTDLHQRFVIAALASNLVFWLLLGATVGLLRQRVMAASESLHDRLA